MPKSVHGVLKHGKVELLEPLDEPDGTEVIVSISGHARVIELKDRRMSPAQAADLRARLATFCEDWDRPEMDVYDRY